MALANKLPSLAFLYALRKSILAEIQKNGGNAAADPDDMAAMGLTGTFTLDTYLAAVQKMIEAMALLRDFEKEPLSRKELKDLDEATELEEAIHIAGRMNTLR